MSTSETNFFWSDAAERRIRNCEADAAEDRALIEAAIDRFLADLDKLHRRDITYADGGNGLDLIVLAQQFRPHSPAMVAMRAREVAIDEENS